MRTGLIAAVGLFLLACGYARADDWHEASSDHFVIYAEEDEQEIRKYSDRLERYHSAMSAMLSPEEMKPSPSNRVTIYVVSSQRIVQKLHSARAKSQNIKGFYVPVAGGSLAIIFGHAVTTFVFFFGFCTATPFFFDRFEILAENG